MQKMRIEFVAVFFFLFSISALCEKLKFVGVANSAFQVEGYPADSDWYRWTQSPGRIHDNTHANIATDFWNRYNEDFVLAKELGSNMFRMSLAWDRIEPKEGQFDEAALEHYGRILKKLRQNNMEPMLTLHHFAFPTWLAKKGGVNAKNIEYYFARYATKVVQKFSAKPYQVKYWVTFNEPTILSLMGFLTGMWPPGHKFDLNGAFWSLVSMAKAHTEFVKQITELKIRDSLKIGIAHHWRPVEANNPHGPFSRGVAHLMNELSNKLFVNMLQTGKAKVQWGSFIAKAEFPVKGFRNLDYLGINYYSRTLVGFDWKFPFFRQLEGPGERNDLGWEIHPEGLSSTLQDACATYNLPIIITENGLADSSDRLRSKFVSEHLKQIIQAQAKLKCSVLGYLHWSLTDNFEWADGLSPRFGLVGVDYPSAIRRPRASFEVLKNWYQKLKLD